MPLFVLGLNHHSAPLAVRERVAFPAETLGEALAALVREPAVEEAAIVSTCNRTELVCAATSGEALTDWLAQHHRLSVAEIAPFLYTLREADAARHLFRVAAGLDSMVLGEPQILGQMKEAARFAEAGGALGSQLHKLFQASFAVAKQVRSATAIGANVVSMAAAAVRLSSRIFEDMRQTRVLCVGAGEMIALCANHFAGAAPRSMSIANRTLSRAQSLADTLADRVESEALPLAALADRLAQFDVVVSCTASPLPVIGLGMVERALKARRHRPMVLVDLAVPRDIEPEVAKLSDAFLYTVDDLAQIVSAGLESRQAAVAQAEEIIAAHVEAFEQWRSRRDAVPTIRALREHGQALQEAEIARAKRLLARGDDPQTVMAQLAASLTNKLLHGPLRYLSEAQEPQINEALATIRSVYQLDAPPAAEPEDPSTS